MAFSFLPLAYKFNDLLPAMNEETARQHHDVIHGAYIAETNRLLLPYRNLDELTIEQVLSNPDHVPMAAREAVRFHGSGHANHQFMWKILGSQRRTQPSERLGQKLDAIFGGFNEFLQSFKSAALAIDGDGWAFLSLTAPRSPELEIVLTRGNGNVLELRKPGVMICDLWRHAYEDDHRGDRAAWIDAYLQIIDWSQCSIRYDRLIAGEPIP